LEEYLVFEEMKKKKKMMAIPITPVKIVETNNDQYEFLNKNSSEGK